MLDIHPFNSDNLSWTLDEKDPMIVVIKYKGEIAMRFFLGEAIESAGRKAVMEHVTECDKSYWLKQWQEDLRIWNEKERDKIVKILSGK